MSKTAQAAFANGYQEALSDIKAQFDDGGAEAALAYILANMVGQK